MPDSQTTSTVTLRVNGAQRVLDVDNRTTLLDLVHDHLALTGTKKGCDHGQCGACTVLVGGRRVNACLLLGVGADAGGRITAVVHEVAERSSTLEEFAEQTAVATRHTYAGPNRRTTHRLVRLDVPTPGFMRAPGETPGMFALESAVDELALACGLDPVELRVRNEPEVDPETGRPWARRRPWPTPSTTPPGCGCGTSRCDSTAFCGNHRGARCRPHRTCEQ